MMLERASILGKTTVLVLWDVEKFFDSLQLDRTIQAAIDLDFPSEILVLGLQVHKAPRLIKACGTLASMIQTTDRSIIAGCTISTSLSRAYLRPALKHLSKVDGHWVAEHVDDVSQMTIRNHATGATVVAIEQG